MALSSEIFSSFVAKAELRGFTNRTSSDPLVYEKIQGLDEQSIIKLAVDTIKDGEINDARAYIRQSDLDNEGKATLMAAAYAVDALTQSSLLQAEGKIDDPLSHPVVQRSVDRSTAFQKMAGIEIPLVDVEGNLTDPKISLLIPGVLNQVIPISPAEWVNPSMGEEQPHPFINLSPDIQYSIPQNEPELSVAD